MSRPRKIRQVQFPPRYSGFKPCGVPRSTLPRIVLTVDEFEALRLVDAEGLDQAAAAQQLKISRPTATRLVESARQKVAQMVIRGGFLVIQGGDYQVDGHLYQCPHCRGFQERRRHLAREHRHCPNCQKSELVEITAETD